MLSGHGTTLSVLGSPDHSRAARVKRRKRKGQKEKAKDDPKGLEERSLVMNKRKILIGGKKRTQLGGPKESKARRACQNGNDGYHKGWFYAVTRPAKVQGRSSSSKTNFQPLKGSKKKGYGKAWESDDWYSSQWPDESWTSAAQWFYTRAQLHGW